MPWAFLCKSKPISFVELSVQVNLMVVQPVGTAPRLPGALGAAGS